AVARRDAQVCPESQQRGTGPACRGRVHGVERLRAASAPPAYLPEKSAGENRAADRRPLSRRHPADRPGWRTGALGRAPGRALVPPVVRCGAQRRHLHRPRPDVLEFTTLRCLYPAELRRADYTGDRSRTETPRPALQPVRLTSRCPKQKREPAAPVFVLPK